MGSCFAAFCFHILKCLKCLRCLVWIVLVIAIIQFQFWCITSTSVDYMFLFEWFLWLCWPHEVANYLKCNSSHWARKQRLQNDSSAAWDSKEQQGALLGGCICPVYTFKPGSNEHPWSERNTWALIMWKPYKHASGDEDATIYFFITKTILVNIALWMILFRACMTTYN